MSRCESTLLTCIATLTVAYIYIRKQRAKQPSRSRSSLIFPHGCCVCAAGLKMGGIDASDWIQEFSDFLCLRVVSHAVPLVSRRTHSRTMPETTSRINPIIISPLPAVRKASGPTTMRGPNSAWTLAPEILDLLHTHLGLGSESQESFQVFWSEGEPPGTRLKSNILIRGARSSSLDRYRCSHHIHGK
jgi:hypothetical protein